MPPARACSLRWALCGHHGAVTVELGDVELGHSQVVPNAPLVIPAEQTTIAARQVMVEVHDVSVQSVDHANEVVDRVSHQLKGLELLRDVRDIGDDASNSCVLTLQFHDGHNERFFLLGGLRTVVVTIAQNIEMSIFVLYCDR